MNKTVLTIIAGVLLTALLGTGAWLFSQKVSLEKQLSDKSAALTNQQTQLASVQQDLANTQAQLQQLQQTPTPTTTPTTPTVKKGKISYHMIYPSEFIPAYRICFTNAVEPSLQYCYWKSNSADKTKYSNDLKKEEVTLPVGKYYFDYAMYDFAPAKFTDQVPYNMYSSRKCVLYANGSEEGHKNYQKYCTKLIAFFKNITDNAGSNGVYLPEQIVNTQTYGGDLVLFEVKENQTTKVGDLSLLPYF